MASIFNKIRTVILSNVHSLLDEAINLNSIGAVKQHIRDLGVAIEETEDAAATAQGDMRTANDNVKLTTASMAELQANIDLLLNDNDESNDHFAAALVEKLMTYEEILAEQQAIVASNQETLASLNDVVGKLRSKHVQMLRQMKALESLEKSANAKIKAADAIKSAAEIAGDAPSVDNLVAGIKQKSNVADARLSRAMGQFSSESADPVRDAKVAARLAEMKAEAKK